MIGVRDENRDCRFEIDKREHFGVTQIDMREFGIQICVICG